MLSMVQCSDGTGGTNDALLFCSDRRDREVDYHLNFGVFFAQLHHKIADEIQADCLDQLDRPQLFRALPCGDESTIIEAIGYIQS